MICYILVISLSLRITEHLGSGEFGTVCKGFWHTRKGSLEVAVKMAHSQVCLSRVLEVCVTVNWIANVFGY